MTCNPSTLVLITADPNHPLALHAYRYVKALLAANHSHPAKHTVAKDTVAKDTDTKNTVAKNTVAKNTDTKNTDTKNTDTKNTDTEDTNAMAVAVFFYGDAAHTANQLRWQVADRAHLTELWQQLSHEYALPLPVCVSTAITRGITDSDNAQRHHLSGANLAAHFALVGLGELATPLKLAKKVIQF